MTSHNSTSAIVERFYGSVDYPPERAQAYQREVIQRLEAMPGVVSAAPAQLLAGFRGNRGYAAIPGLAGATQERLEVTANRVGPIVLLIVALAASYFPARRAAKVSPLVALRHQ